MVQVPSPDHRSELQPDHRAEPRFATVESSPESPIDSKAANAMQPELDFDGPAAQEAPRHLAANDVDDLVVPAEPGDDMPETVGGILRKARLERIGKPVAEIAQELRIRPHLLEALETDDYDKLPGMTYAAGFLKTYAKYLGLDGAALVERFKESGRAAPMETPLVFPEPLNDPRLPKKALVGIAAALCVAIYGVWFSFSDKQTASVAKVSAPRPELAAIAIDPQPVAETTAPAVIDMTAEAPVAGTTTETTPAPARSPEERSFAAISSAEAATPTEVIPGQGDGHSILLKATADAWVRIEAPGERTIMEKILKAGETMKTPSGQGLVMMTGNAGGLEIVVDGEVLGPLGAPGAVRRNVTLDVASLKESFAPVQ